MSAHTPGPWATSSLSNGTEWTVSIDGGDMLADLTGCPNEQANARLIAAAPDLFKALKALVSTARTFRDVPKDEQEWTSIDDDALEAAFDAIAKATGEQA